jgi:hypothetical protein
MNLGPPDAVVEEKFTGQPLPNEIAREKSIGQSLPDEIARKIRWAVAAQ